MVCEVIGNLSRHTSMHIENMDGFIKFIIVHKWILVMMIH
jgi:hypothetical protein